MSIKERLNNILSQRIMVMDGAMGTSVQAFHLTEEHFLGERFKNHPKSLKGNNDILNLTQPEIVTKIYRNYLEAGAEIIETNTFNANVISQADYDMQEYVYEINKTSAILAKKTCKEFEETDPEKLERFVAGSIGPTNRTASISPSVSDPSFRNISSFFFQSSN